MPAPIERPHERAAPNENVPNIAITPTPAHSQKRPANRSRRGSCLPLRPRGRAVVTRPPETGGERDQNDRQDREQIDGHGLSLEQERLPNIRNVHETAVHIKGSDPFICMRISGAAAPSPRAPGGFQSVPTVSEPVTQEPRNGCGNLQCSRFSWMP